MSQVPSQGRVAIGLSGGVDSAVAAMLLRRNGRHVCAATLRLWDGGGEMSCCGPPAVARAAACAAALGAAFAELDEQERFRRLVVEPYVTGYLAGETPNPCVECNRVRLAWLVDWALRQGAATVATGHYAQLVRRGGRVFVARGEDRSKDQSYMLWRVAPETLARLEFPLGQLKKGFVRRMATDAGLKVAEQPESQEGCFAPHGPARFLEEWGVVKCDGDVIDSHGSVLARHPGQWRFTVGQRRGLRVAAAQPMYVLARSGAANQVVVGPREQLAQTEFRVRELVDRGLGEEAGLSVQLRYRSAAVPVASLIRDGETEATVRLAIPFEAVAPGQSAVFYEGDRVIGGGVIDGEKPCDTLPG